MLSRMKREKVVDFMSIPMIINVHNVRWAWNSVVVKALRCQSEGLGIDPQ